MVHAKLCVPHEPCDSTWDLRFEAEFPDNAKTVFRTAT
jgi:hypothetical protein